jgi:hypothetical protein
VPEKFMRSDEDSSITRNDEAIAHPQSEKTIHGPQVKNLKSRQTVPALVTPAGFPRHRLSQCLRIPKAIIEGNGGKECTDREAAAFAGARLARGIRLEICSAVKYGLLERRSVGRVRPTKLAWRIVKSKTLGQEMTAMRKALLHAPVLSDLYRCLQGRPLSDLPSLIESLKPSIEISSSDMHSLVVVLIRSLGDANLLEVVEGRQRVVGCQRKS